MKTLPVEQLIDILDGKLIKGDLNLEIHDATRYHECVKKPNTLLFLFSRSGVEWNTLYKYKPCIVVTDKIIDELLLFDGCTIIEVDDDDKAYQKFVDFYRGQFDIPVIAVTGTSGKSTTVGMIQHVLNKYVKVTGTRNSANGRTGHLLNLINIDDTTEAAVFETPVGQPGDITNAFRYFKPQIGIITNIGIHHLDCCITEDAYIKAKGEMLSVLPSDGILIINYDDELTKKLPIDQFIGRVITVSTEREATFKASDIEYVEKGMNFILTYNKVKYPFYVPGPGIHQVYNALQSIAALHELGIGFKEINEALKTFEKLPLRFQIKRGLNNCILIDDSWEFTNMSLKAGLMTLDGISHGMKKAALLGSIHRTGHYTKQIVAQYAEIIQKHGPDIDTLITVGRTARLLDEALKEKGFKGKVYAFGHIYGIYELLLNILNDQTILLIKMRYEDNPEFIKSLICGK